MILVLLLGVVVQWGDICRGQLTLGRGHHRLDLATSRDGPEMMTTSLPQLPPSICQFKHCDTPATGGVEV